jgi:hypothetical protein
VVIGHPKLNAPAFGWVKEVKADGDLLLAKFGEVNPDFEAAVKAGSSRSDRSRCSAETTESCGCGTLASSARWRPR